MLPPTSIFHRIPGALDISLRRLMGALAYASDSAELSYIRLQEAARDYRPANNDLVPDPSTWTPANRLSIIVDSWAVIDHVNRARALILQFPLGGPPPKELEVFLSTTKPALDLRNRIQHLDKDISTGANCSERYPVLGSVSWADARVFGGHIRYSVSSGPAIDRGTMALEHVTDVDGAGDVLDFNLVAADKAARLDDLVLALREFMKGFEVAVNQAVINSIRDGATKKGISLLEGRPTCIADATMALARRRLPDGKYWTDQNGMAMTVEVPIHLFDISQTQVINVDSHMRD